MGPYSGTPNGTTPDGFKWVFARKGNEGQKAKRYKSRLMAQGFTQRVDIDYEETYSWS